ncbi:DUF1816 domain-containing protein [Romeria aff. gracilis LEGE 07310]|uniref:DUF1816 domain-containing protein n=1 Tax=Vasconcelosia minhoensis LEGE 07310 TaxID=915328 RepID=A0A8J7AR97_9CYAN|nr:DUF1816 domain-containing protein [Romeria gracilis]MBE9079134.1 DUF1816 domain-containing protein [Romeria aff. gracilis LEGE 07310]
MNSILDSLLGLLGFSSKDWWVKLTTVSPDCIYYFGPFETEAEAMQAKPGYIEDLEAEGTQEILTAVLHCKQPDQLTIELAGSTSNLSPAWSNR